MAEERTFLGEPTSMETYADRLREAAETLRGLGGDRAYDLADACDYAAHGFDVEGWCGQPSPDTPDFDEED